MHARGQVQATFDDWVASRGPWAGAPPRDALDGRVVPVARLTDRLRGCGDVMSPAACDALRLGDEATYAEGVAALGTLGAG
jgi:hypothetical protein